MNAPPAFFRGLFFCYPNLSDFQNLEDLSHNQRVYIFTNRVAHAAPFFSKRAM